MNEKPTKFLIKKLDQNDKINTSTKKVFKFKKITRNLDNELMKPVLSDSNKFFQSMDSSAKTPIKALKKVD